MVQRRLVPDTILISKEQIQEVVERLGSEVTLSCVGASSLLVVGVLKGSFVFLADLARHIRRPIEVDFVTVSSYGPGVVSSGNVEIHQDTRIDVADRSIVLVEDIVDSGRTIEKLIEHFLKRGAREVVVCAMLTRGKRSGVLTGVVLKNDMFVVGYGLDHHERYRGLPEIWNSVWLEVDGV